jgi:hypothetical protein
MAEVSLHYVYLSFAPTFWDIVEASHNDDCFLTADDSRCTQINADNFEDIFTCDIFLSAYSFSQPTK